MECSYDEMDSLSLVLRVFFEESGEREQLIHWCCVVSSSRPPDHISLSSEC